MTIALELPQTTDLLDPTAKLSSGFIKSLPVLVGLWCPSKLRNAAADFNPLKKNFGTLNGGITTVPGGFGMLGQAWNFNGSQYIQGSGNLGISGDAEFTISALISASNVSATATVFALLAASGGAGLDAALVIGGNGTGSISVWFGTDGVTTSTGIISAGTTYLLTATKTPGLPSTTTKVYVNSLSQSVSAQFGNSNPNITATRWNIGAGWWNSNTSQQFSGNIYKVTVFSKALTAAQVSSLYSCLLTGKPFPLFEPDTLYIDEPQTSTTLNLTSKSFVFSSSNSQASIQRNINTQSDSLSDSQGNITFTRDLKSTLESRSFSSSATSVLRPLVSELISQSESGAAETRQILASSIIASQSFSSGKFALSAFINLESTAFAESFSYVEINLSRALNSTGFSLSDLLAEISVKRNLSSIGLSLSDSISQETILRPLDSESISQAKDHAEISIEQLLTSEVLSSSLAKGQFTTQLYTKFEVLSYRRYSSQYFVQSGSVNDSGQ